MSVDTVEPATTDGWCRDVDVDVSGHQHAVVVVMAAGFDDPATGRLPRHEQRTAMTELAQILGLLPPPPPPVVEVEPLAPGMVLEAVSGRTPGRVVELVSGWPGSGVWVVQVIRHPVSSRAGRRLGTLRESSLRRDWRVVPPGPADGAGS